MRAACVRITEATSRGKLEIHPFDNLPSTPQVSDWWQLALQPGVVRRALKTALLVGTILLAINHGELLFFPDRFSAARGLKMALTILVPYLVSTFSSVAAMREMRRDSAGKSVGE